MPESKVEAPPTAGLDPALTAYLEGHALRRLADAMNLVLAELLDQRGR